MRSDTLLYASSKLIFIWAEKATIPHKIANAQNDHREQVHARHRDFPIFWCTNDGWVTQIVSKCGKFS